MKISAVITAGGTSSRFGNTNKLLEKINGKEIIKYTVDAFINSNINEIIISANSSIIEILRVFFLDRLRQRKNMVCFWLGESMKEYVKKEVFHL